MLSCTDDAGILRGARIVDRVISTASSGGALIFTTDRRVALPPLDSNPPCSPS